MNAVGGALGVLIGGLLTEYGGRRWVVLVNVPMAACVLALACPGVAAVLRALTRPARDTPDAT
jgi:hypothetical protein